MLHAIGNSDDSPTMCIIAVKFAVSHLEVLLSMANGIYPGQEGATVKCHLRTSSYVTQPHCLNLCKTIRITGHLKLSEKLSQRIGDADHYMPLPNRIDPANVNFLKHLPLVAFTLST